MAIRILSGLFQPGRMGDAIIVVSGLPRSGTSMLMRMLEAGGLPVLMDRLREADADNPRGYYEYEPVKKLRDGDISWLAQAKGRVVKIISALLPNLPDQYRYKILFIHREIAEVLASQRQMLIRRGEDPNKVDDVEMAGFFQKHLEQVESWMGHQKNINALPLNYNFLLQDPAPEVKRIRAFLGNQLNEERMLTVVDPSLYRQRSGEAK